MVHAIIKWRFHNRSIAHLVVALHGMLEPDALRGASISGLSDIK
jgi:hypothetical protein